MFNPTWITAGVSVLSGLLTVAMLWGVVRATVADLKEEVNRLRESTDVLEDVFFEFREETRVRLAQSEMSTPRKRARRRRSK